MSALADDDDTLSYEIYEIGIFIIVLLASFILSIAFLVGRVHFRRRFHRGHLLVPFANADG